LADGRDDVRDCLVETPAHPRLVETAQRVVYPHDVQVRDSVDAMTSSSAPSAEVYLRERRWVTQVVIFMAILCWRHANHGSMQSKYALRMVDSIIEYCVLRAPLICPEA
jgi:hypothetical protein